MSAPLSSEDEQRYTEIIDGILATANLETISRKKIREGLESALGGKDLSDQKTAIKTLIEERFDAISTNPTDSSAPVLPHAKTESPKPSPKRQANGYGDDEVDDDGQADGDEIQVSIQPPKKKQRKSEETEDADAKLAAMLQAQENRLGRSTRGGGPKSKPVKKKKATPRKKSSNKVRPEDDSDISGSEASGPKRRKAGGGFQKPFNLSEPLTALLSRPQVVKKLWEHIKGNDLQDPRDKRQILCDEKMQAVFKQSKVDMFQMNRLVGDHLYPVEEAH
ncbi:uncharacterized protein JN550_012632 [Neoarthrinium moseri]|uniref:uncharacterized protein n=1 Tax=Neoarthrinium moseri TaxID=1658444 RepID=UPI001FDD0D31|nr:uncharacterized protein JN550_012632 [Neoarthrinium moseri]KAI1858499.1 hypothetical protein JN550_012632 [Neoarthrinium moseri]